MKYFMILILLVPLYLFSINVEHNWTNYYGTDNSDAFNDGILTSDGNVLLCGFKKLTIDSWYNLYLMKCNLEGVIIWEQYYEWPEHNEGIAIEEASDGCFIILVESGTTSSDYSPRLVKIDSDGQVVWGNIFGGLDSVVDFVKTDNDQFIIHGSELGENYWFAKVDDNGDLLWTQENEGVSNLRMGVKLLKSSNTDEFIWLYTDYSTYNKKCGVRKLDSEGEVIWDNLYESTGNFYPSSIEEIDNSYVITGRLENNSSSIFQTLIISDSGEFIANYPIDVTISSSIDYLNLQNVTNIYLGHTIESGNRYILAITDENNQLNWNSAYLEGNYYNIPKSILKISSDKFWVIGKAQYESWTDLEGFIAEFQIDPTEVTEEDINYSPVHLSNYPNPFNPTTTISFSTERYEQNEQVGIEIYNVKGQLVKIFPPSMCHPEPVEGRQTYTITWNGTDNQNNTVSSGVYFINLKSGDRNLARKKCVLLK